MMNQESIAPLRSFVASMTALVSASSDERQILAAGRHHLSRLIAADTWLPEIYATPLPDRYAQYLLHCDPLERFSVVSFVWGPGQRTPVHDHTVWGLIGVLRGAELCEEYLPGDPLPRPAGHGHVLERGQVEAVSPTLGDWHRVSNALPDHTSISIHVYGGNIGAVRRHMLDAQGQLTDFVSGYTANHVPNLWDRSPSVRAALASGAGTGAGGGTPSGFGPSSRPPLSGRTG